MIRWFSLAPLPRAASLALKWIPMGLALAFATLAAAHKDNPFQHFTQPKGDPPEAIGDYSAGCLQGARALPLDGKGFQVMHPQRLRYFGHPRLLGFITRLGREYHAAGHGVLLIGDLSQPRGGKARGGHASHQNGLDVDIWYWQPPYAKKRSLSAQEREQLGARSILDGRAGRIRAAHAPAVTTALRITAEQPEVDRVFVNPIIKRQLCEEAGDERAWLRKIRPWYGHDDHFHVRLKCPGDSPACEAQAAIAQGDGCAGLDWWFDEQAQADRRKARTRYQNKVIDQPPWPQRCEQLLD